MTVCLLALLKVAVDDALVLRPIVQICALARIPPISTERIYVRETDRPPAFRVSAFLHSSLILYGTNCSKHVRKGPSLYLLKNRTVRHLKILILRDLKSLRSPVCFTPRFILKVCAALCGFLLEFEVDYF
jgi:hypothetical protein